ncbi:MAG: aspartate kinase [Pseudanabaena sp. M158S2SP1A06QC]|jgi:aspartate kinase|uniref:aspartate kinase n=1 Tax=Pseudanabaena mucicola TaxID=71190 RepID=UPI00257757C0|nr:aspartate kinase [Pseudanabaena mucicola]MCA6573921.1 aspartate kinase [Pseudanabaena sp. M53BS1SP1A06MG]MCA6582913.1 aspartate kinase [Pseudanabaena sp. M34BS1SP1A06MG]MCA6588372.1 aspartate kinase [Pseudanabaena sp. M109S1SP1A06QC]MCA6590951.1 aspartate kinase [Pseudanabaena sp. M38BS1SP1A06MG]MCA6595207.1 aspartate kinase [Pseudanabaena sp. M046S1SP1A06QC]MCA6598891.1 aspartate kinase [Pseudanabaena sp. M57BS1SP1A06MG]MCA6605564.1 aspartate kinase [Pseudanabaena sp. M007S1SP1A06QC]MCA
MALIVQKYGGSSVADADRIKAVRDRIKRTVDAGNQVVVVVSAMGKTTDGLVALAESVAATHAQTLEEIDAKERETDLLLATGEQVTIALLSMALQAVGQPAIAMNGSQVRVVTEPKHTRARILYVEADQIKSALALGKVVVIAGFQGVALDEATGLPSTEITTLGRGGSDTSAVAIAAAIEADVCEIYTDVPGILTTDPRIVPKAQMLDEITCDEMLELASLGAKVLHPRSVEIARNFGVKMCVRSSWLDDPGTVITSPRIGIGDLKTLEVNRFVENISIDYDQVKIALLQIPDRPGIASQLFKPLAEQSVNVDLIIQAVQEIEGVNDIAFTIPQNQLQLAELVTRSLEIGASSVTVDSNVAKISIIGVGMIGRPGVAAKMFSALAEAGVNIQMISTSEIKISCVIAATDGEVAIAALQKVFDVPVQTSTSRETILNTNNPPVRGVALDRNRARIAVQKVPDRPGMAAKILEQLAEQNISLDMIVQSQSDRDVNEIAFTVAITDRAKAETALKQVANDLGYGEVSCDDDISKVSIVGAGMINQSGIAARMFGALADASINIEMIATSEIKVSCVVRDNQAEQALMLIHQEFNLSGDRAIEVPSVLKK